MLKLMTSTRKVNLSPHRQGFFRWAARRSTLFDTRDTDHVQHYFSSGRWQPDIGQCGDGSGKTGSDVLCTCALAACTRHDFLYQWLRTGEITGVADDGPSGIATYSQAGAQFGLNMLWTMPLVFPLMAAIQSMCGRIGRVTGKGLPANIKGAFPPVVLLLVVVLLLIANMLNIAADVAALFTVHVPWTEVAIRTVWPKFQLNSTSAAVIVGVFGTTISPYLFFWQASEEVENMQAGPSAASLLSDRRGAGKELRRIQEDTWSGMLYSDITAYFIILATAVTLHVAGINDIETAAQAASALRPLAGDFVYTLFDLGILGVGLIGVPVLAGSPCR